MEVRFGINTCFAVKRWPRPEDWAPIVRDRLGLRLVQHSLDLVDLESGPEAIASHADDLRAAVARAGLELHSTFTGLAAYSANLLLHPDESARVAARAWYRRAMSFTAAAGGRMTGGHVGAYSVAEWSDSTRRTERWADLKAELRALAVDAAAAGLEAILVENLAAAREPSTIAQLRDLATRGSPGRAAISPCLDVGHQCVPGTFGDDRDPYAWLRELGPLSPVVQLQQSDADGDHHWPFTAERNAAGRITADAVLDALEAGGTRETALVIEVIPPFEQDDEVLLDELDATVSYWREALVRRGYRAD